MQAEGKPVQRSEVNENMASSGREACGREQEEFAEEAIQETKKSTKVEWQKPLDDRCVREKLGRLLAQQE